MLPFCGMRSKLNFEDKIEGFRVTFPSPGPLYFTQELQAAMNTGEQNICGLHTLISVLGLAQNHITGFRLLPLA